jgi:hypothetical protein
VWPPIASHIICNFVGLPDVGFTVAPPAPKPVVSSAATATAAANKGAEVIVDRSYVRGRSEYSSLYRYRHFLLACHALGLALFVATAMPLTERFATKSIYWR